jgi:hypothetical protein
MRNCSRAREAQRRVRAAKREARAANAIDPWGLGKSA